jgi:peptidyl-prolyl cis-trans isomerase D
MALVVVSFVGMINMQQGDTSRVIAQVNSKRILSTDHNRQYQQALSQTERQYNRTLGDAEQQQIWEQVKQQMIQDEVVLQYAVSLGLEVSDDAVVRLLFAQPAFRNEEGKFDEGLYQRRLKRLRYTQAKYEEELRNDMLRDKLTQLIYMGATISEPAVREAYIESRTLVDIKYVRVNPTAFADDLTVTPEEVETWLTENEDLARETYDRDFSRRYDHPDQIRLKMIRLGLNNDGVGIDVLLAEVRKIKEKIEAGASFDDMVQKWSEDPSVMRGGDLGLRAVAQLPDGDKFDGMVVGQVSDVITSDNDVRLYRVEERIEPIVDAFDDVKEKIAEDAISAERLPGLAAAFAEERLLPQWKAAGAPPQELIDEKGMYAQNSGLSPTQATRASGPPPAMLKASRSAAVDTVLPEVYENFGSLYVGQLIERKDADMTEFEADRGRIRETVLDQRRRAFFEAWVADAKSLASIK